MGTLHAVPEPELLPRGAFLVGAIIDALMAYANDKACAGLKDSTPILSANPALENVTIGDVKQHYQGLFQRWVKKYGIFATLDSMIMTFAEDGLDWHAHKILAEHPELEVVVMGHTHSIRPAGGAGREKNPDPNYYNDGCWCTNGPSYVRITGSQGETVLFTDAAARGAGV